MYIISIPFFEHCSCPYKMFNVRLHYIINICDIHKYYPLNIVNYLYTIKWLRPNVY